ncbi:tRNA (N(6)-L-threonylcarbamoyladenosine(37)-C(2))-methylthiotransferase MtaB [Gimesia sp.]|uniref:tRNA (N(6)-L-threonylcarbamoyladenosine(37)-C(2))- methylthiotransferase MtaB n=1 Tax=Gimesia sp. TaxID=2024833 RepID=UPI003A8D00E7
MTLTQLHTPGKDKTCQLVTLGCKVNQYETQLVKEALEKNGYREAGEAETADLCVVNTCTVTATGDSKGRKLIRNLAKNNPGTKILVMGCYATRDPKTVSELPGVFEVVTDKRELPDILERHGIVDMPTGISEFEGRKRAYVKVQDGCILRCTYCIIPSVRPGLQSRSPQDIEAEVRRLVDNGFKEIVLTGIHVGHFGVDTTRGKSGKPPFRLWHLFRKLDQIPGDWRMRLSSVETAEINDDFISAAADCEHLCPQFHPSLQSGSDTVLRRMKRRYHVSRFLEKLQRMRERLNHPSFTTDVIVGFPGETDEEFAETMRACEEAAFMKIHIFPFSARKSTPAATYEDQILPEIRQERCAQLADLERSLAQKFYHTLIDRDLEVMIERECDDRPGWVRGTDRWYAPVVCPGTKADLGKFVYARGSSAHLEFLEADRLSP